MPRLFTAVEVSESVRERSLELRKHLLLTGAEINWEKRENLHITLKFLGEVHPEQVNQVCRTVVEAVQDREPFEFELFGAGAFPSLRRPNILWLGVREGAEQIDKLFRAIQRPLVELGFPREERRFTPHLTLGRLKRGARAPRELSELLQQYAEFAAVTSLVREVVVFESQLAPGGSIYRALCRAPLQCAE